MVSAELVERKEGRKAARKELNKARTRVKLSLLAFLWTKYNLKTWLLGNGRMEG